MELKSASNETVTAAFVGSNRTFMELKLPEAFPSNEWSAF